MIEKNKIYLGNNLEILKTFPDNSIDSVVTDPPYGLGKEPNAIEVLQSWITTGYHEVKGKGFMARLGTPGHNTMLEEFKNEQRNSY